MLVLKVLVGLHRTVQLQLLQHYWSLIDLDYLDIEWFALEMNRDHSVIFEIASKYCKTRLIIFFAVKDRKAVYSQQKQDQELTVAQIMNFILQNSDLN